MIAGSIFGANTFYSAEGSSLSIRAMIYLVGCYACLQNRPLRIAAGRNAHKAFLSAVSFLDAEIDWLLPQNSTYLSCAISARDVAEYLDTCAEMPVAVYITSPDYLGNTADIKSISEVCKRYGILLAVDNAHGAYLSFLEDSLHPIHLGADLCCDSAHKTLPVLTGGAYLHISNSPDSFFTDNAKKALSLFGSTSPSYLILESLDKANLYLGDAYGKQLKSFAEKVGSLKQALIKNGYSLYGNESIKITLEAKKYGYTGINLADILRENNIECEFADNDYTVLMLTPQTTDNELEILKNTLLSIDKKQAITQKPPQNILPKKAMTIREATLSPCETVNASDSLGRVLAFADVGCPPAVPIIVSGEIIDENTLKAFEYYGITKVSVVK